jgi:oxygen-dependent protoporphyrinogen oxidase
MRSAFPKLYEMERDFGSLIMGTIRRTKDKADADFPRTFSFRGGLKTWIAALAEEIGDGIRLSTPVSSIGSATGGGFSVNGEEFDGVVVSTPSWAAADLIENRDEQLAGSLQEINYPQLAVVILGFASEQIKGKLDGFGFLVASKENRPILGTLYHSAVFPERAPDGFQLLVTFVGGVRSGKSLDTISDDDLTAMVLDELRDILGVTGGPDFVHLKRWKRSIPQYRVGYEDVTKACSEFESENPGIYFCSNFYRGISMGDCVKNAFKTADHVENYLNQHRRDQP